jgi:hypothetical protein
MSRAGASPGCSFFQLWLDYFFRFTSSIANGELPLIIVACAIQLIFRLKLLSDNEASGSHLDGRIFGDSGAPFCRAGLLFYCIIRF